MTFNIVKIGKILGKERENLENLVDDEKKSSEILAVEMEIFSEKNVIQKSWFPRIFFVPPKLGARSPPLAPA